MKVKELEGVVDGLGRRLVATESILLKVRQQGRDQMVDIANDVRRDLYAALEEARDAQRMVNIGLAVMLIVVAVAVAAVVFLG